MVFSTKCVAKKRLAEAVADYYVDIDAGNIDAVLALFAPDSRYQRADACYEDKAAIERFYITERKIVGKHTIESFVSGENIIVVQGTFQGSGHDGSHRQIGFTDWWRFNDSGRVTERKTYHAAGSEYVKE